jgi:hypothetical protein
VADTKTPLKRKTRPLFQTWPEELVHGRRVSIAYREAGYALAYLYFGYTVHQLVLRPVDKVTEKLDLLPANKASAGVQEGHTSVSGPLHLPWSRLETEEWLRSQGCVGQELQELMSLARARIEMNLIIRLAGLLTQALYEQRPIEAVLEDDVSAGDGRKIQCLLTGWFEVAEHEQVLARMTELAKSLVCSSHGRRLIKGIAGCLVRWGELHGKTATTMFEREYDRPIRTWRDWEVFWMDQPPTPAQLQAGRLPQMLGYLIPRFDGAPFSQEWEDALWASFFTKAPARRRQSVADPV